MRFAPQISGHEAAGLRQSIRQPTQPESHNGNPLRPRQAVKVTKRATSRWVEPGISSWRTSRPKTYIDPRRSRDPEHNWGTCTMSSPSIPAGLNEWAGQTTTGVRWQVMRGDTSHVLQRLDENRFDCVVTSPPYFWQRDYKVENQIGLESTIADYVAAITDSMDAVRRISNNLRNRAGYCFSIFRTPTTRQRENQKAQTKKIPLVDSVYVRWTHQV